MIVLYSFLVCAIFCYYASSHILNNQYSNSIERSWTNVDTIPVDQQINGIPPHGQIANPQDKQLSFTYVVPNISLVKLLSNDAFSFCATCIVIFLATAIPVWFITSFFTMSNIVQLIIISVVSSAVMMFFLEIVISDYYNIYSSNCLSRAKSNAIARWYQSPEGTASLNRFIDYTRKAEAMKNAYWQSPAGRQKKQATDNARMAAERIYQQAVADAQAADEWRKEIKKLRKDLANYHKWLAEEQAQPSPNFRNIGNMKSQIVFIELRLKELAQQ